MKIDRTRLMQKVNSISTTTQTFTRLGYIDKFTDSTQRLLRILPPKSLLTYLKDNRNSNKSYDLDEFPWRELGMHYGISSNTKDRVYCPKAMQGSPCPICEFVEELKSSKSKEDIERAQLIRLQTKFQYLAIDRAKVAEGPKFWEISRTPHNKIIGIFQDTDYGDISDPEEGYDLKVKRIAFGRNEMDQYSILPSKKPSPLLSLEDEDEVDWDGIFGYLDKIPSLSETPSLLSYDELSDVLEGKTTLKEVWSSHKGPSEVEKDEDSEVEEEADEEEAPEPQLMRRSRR